MNILLIQNMLYVPAVGGANKASRLLIEGLAERAHDCRVVAPAVGSHGPQSRSHFHQALSARGIVLASSSNGADVFRHQGVEVHAVADASQLRAHVVDQIREFKPNWTMVSSQDPGQVLLEAALSESDGRVVYLVQAPWDLPFGSGGVYASTSSTELIGKTAGIITISNYLRDYIKRWSGLESTIIHFPVYGQGPFPHLGSFDNRFVTIVNPSAIKGISIFMALARKFPEIEFAAVPTWATTNQDQSALKQLSNVTLLDPVDDINEIFAQTRVLLVPSLWDEAFGYIVVEAMLRGIPVLASDVGGVPEAKLGLDYVLPVRPIVRYEDRFDDKNSPVPIVPEQDISPWVNALGELTSDRARYEQLSIASRETALAFVSRIGVGPFEEYLANLAPKAGFGRANGRSQSAQGNSKTSEPLAMLSSMSSSQRTLLALRALKLKKQGGGGSQSRAIQRRSEADVPPQLSFAQQRLWLLDQLQPGNSAYNLPAYVRLKGQLDTIALERTFSEVVRRHEVLRTTFSMVDVQPVQLISPPEPLMLQLSDLTQLPLDEREAQLQSLAVEEARRPFDLARGPLLRVRLVSLGAEDYALLVTIHHIVSDEWSLGILIREVATLYRAYAQGQPSPLPELPIQYADFSHWQRDWLKEEVLEQQLRYWRDQLSDAPTLLELPTDRPRPPVQTYHGAHRSLSLNAELTHSLKALSQREGVTLFMTLLAAFQTLLYRYSGQDDVLVGTPIAGRNRAEVEPLIGFFVNTLVLRTKLSGELSFAEMLERVKAVALGAYAHQDVPFEMLVDELQPERSLSHSPLFQVMFTMLNAPRDTVEVKGLKFSPLRGESGTAKFDLSLSVMETGQSLVATLEHNTDLFDDETIRRMLQHFERLLTTAVSDPHQRLSLLPLLSDEEHHQLVYEWNNTALEYPHENCIHQLFESQASRTPLSTAISFSTLHLSYAELNSRANQLAHHLLSLGIGSESIVAILLDRSLEMVISILAVLKAGAAYLPLDPLYPQERLSFMIEDSGAALLLTQESLQAVLSTNVATLCIDSQWHNVSQHSTEQVTSTVCSENLAYVIYTSGSTGKPKGVQITHRSAVNFLCSMREKPGLCAGDVLLAVTTLCFDIAGLELYLPLITGAEVRVASREAASNALEMKREIESAQVSVMQATPATWRMLIDAGWQADNQSNEDGNDNAKSNHLHSLKVLCGGEALSTELARQLVERAGEVWNLYGPTETTIWSTLREVRADDVMSAAVVSIGRPIANTQVYILDEEMQAVPVGVNGELYIGGDGVARGYLNRPELTSERFIPDPFSQSRGARLYRTGDVARYLPSGEIEYVGRRDQQVKVRGYRIEVGEIEAVLSEHPSIREAVVVAREDTVGDKRLVAYVVADEGGQVNVSELRDCLNGKLPEYMVPSHFIVLEELPLTANGKVNRGALPAADFKREELDTAFVAPRNLVEQLLTGIWQKVLGVGLVGVQDNFFQLGGHSLLAMQVVSKVREVLKVEIPLRQMFEQPTVAGLALSIESGPGQELRVPPIVPISREEDLPLSFGQQRLWFLNQLEADKSVYLISIAVRLAGRLDVEALERTFTEIIRRQESLRTTFANMEGQPVQIINSPAPYVLGVVDLSTRPEDEREAEARRLAAEAQRPFDLERGSLIRASLMRLAEEDHVLLWTMHHIISDGWSINVLVQEVVALYRAYSTGQPSPLAELPIQYADYAHWQREWLQGEVLDEQLAYWRDQLRDAPALLELPTDRPRPAIQTHRGAVHSIQLSKELSEGLKALSQREGVTLFMTLLAAFQTLLYRYSGQDDVLVGTPIAGRNRAEVEQLIGFFANTLVLRSKLEPALSFRELLQRVREIALGAYAHQELPFEKLVEELQPERSLSQSPLFQVMLMLQNAPREDIELPGLRISHLGGENVTAKFDLTLAVVEAEQGLAASVEYNIDLFDQETIRRMLQHFENLLSAATDPEQALSRLPLLSAEEHQQLVFEWNETAADYPQNQCVQQLFESQVARTPGEIALCFVDEQLTYRELNRRANQLAHYLRSMGVGPETLVAVCLERSLEMVIAVLGTLKAGGAYVPLDPAYPQERLQWMVEDSGARVLLTQESLRRRADWPEAMTIVSIDKEWAAIAAESKEAPASDVGPDNLAYVIYTSGSTGRPKGVQLQHRSVTNFLCSMQHRPGLSAQDKLLAVTTLSFDIAGLELYLPLITGTRVILASRETAANPLQLKEELQHHAVTVMQATPATWRMLIDAGWQADNQSDEDNKDNAKSNHLHSLKVLCGGEALSSELAHQLIERAAEVWNLYGPTETTIWSTLREVRADDATGASVVSIGRPIANTQVYILDEEMQAVPVGVSGELYIGGDGVARGYLNRPELTSERFIPDPFSTEAGRRLYRTGDVARYLPSGEIEYVGRLDQQVKVRGYRIEVGEIEAVLSEHPSIRESVVVAREDTVGDKRLVAYVVAEEGQRVQINDLRGHVQRRVPEYMVPSVFIEVEQMPLTANGKVDRRALPVPEQTRPEMGVEYVGARTATEEMVAGIWAEVLRVERVGVYDNFFQLGGHSLLAMQILARVRKAFQVEIPVRPLFESPTVETLAAVITQYQNEQKDNATGMISKADPLDESQLLTKLDELSEAEVDALLNQMLADQSNVS